MIWCQSQIVLHLMNNSAPSEQAMQRDFNRVLVTLVGSAEAVVHEGDKLSAWTEPFQAITPLFALMGPTFFYIMQVLVDFHAPCFSYISSVMSLITIINPLTMILFIPSYRRALPCAMGGQYPNVNGSGYVSEKNLLVANELRPNQSDSKLSA